jgi:hypothetical protein
MILVRTNDASEHWPQVKGLYAEKSRLVRTCL